MDREARRGAMLLARLKEMLRSAPGGAYLVLLYRLLSSVQRREEFRLIHHRADRLYQLGGRTAPDRYPPLFAALRDQLSDAPAPSILSFGCSYGDEILSLRRYLPRAVLSGIDINRVRIDQARKRIADSAVRLTAAASIAEAGGGSFDAITCLSVLRRNDTPQGWGKLPKMTFAAFAQAIADFDRHLKPGGFLLLYHTSFRFIDTDVACRYTPLYAVAPFSHETFLRYDRQDRPVQEPREERFALYRKDM